MKNRPINPKKEQANLAGADVTAMVRDRRSGRGKEAPAHLPRPSVVASQISDDEAALLQHALRERATGEGIVARADAAIEANMRHLVSKYGLVGEDSINPATGKITRRPRAAS